MPKEEGSALLSSSIETLLIAEKAIPGPTLAQEVVKVFESRPDLDSLVVLDAGKIGFLSRVRFLATLASKYGFALYEKRPIAMLMETDALMVDGAEDTIEVISKALRRDAKHIYDDIVILDNEKYSGIVSMRSLMSHNREILSSSLSQISLLDEKAQKLEELNRLQSEFVANMTHELRAPLNAIIGVAKLVVLDPRVNTDLKDGVQIIQTRGQELLMLINNILDFHKIESHQMKPLIEDCDPAETIRDVVQLGHILIKGLPIKLESNIQPISRPFHTDPIFLKRILINLVSNAVKFTEEGRIRIELEPKDGGAMVHIEDTGIGIEKEERARLFQKYTQLESAATKRFGGTGLGLAIVKNLVDQLQGEIFVESYPKVGTTFSVWLKNLNGKE
ncbi:MAG: hypothetical protein C5B54_00025 [Acidobacteria bacterium]|nr:MAG: hypothetical protein C5B54_00025 [Acidobacteriota bacterium]